jgi:signal transduction histidine kinase
VLIQQVLLNLILNAVEAMQAVVDRPRSLGIRTEACTQEGIVVTVKDAGMGIGPGQTDQIFTAFYTTKSDGLGLGLPLSRSVIEEHGGKLWVEPNEYHGVTFRFTLPVNGKTAA